MTLTETRTWDYEAVEVGQRAQPIAEDVTLDSIVRHASTSRSMNPDHYSDAPPFAMPTQIFSLAPKNRGGVAENNGMTIITAHATPFAKCEGRWFAPIRLGDTVTSVATVLEKYERRGNKFVTLRLEAHNGRGEKLAEIDHTSIFEFGKRDRPLPGSGTAARRPGPDLEPSRSKSRARTRRWRPSPSRPSRSEARSTPSPFTRPSRPRSTEPRSLRTR